MRFNENDWNDEDQLRASDRESTYAKALRHIHENIPCGLCGGSGRLSELGETWDCPECSEKE